jgi:hypothetical protein
MTDTDRVVLAREAVLLFGHDLRATRRLESPSFEFRDEAGDIRVAYWGQYSTMTLLGRTRAEIAVEIADFMQEEVMEDLHAAWPECLAHSVGLHPELASGRPSWVCRAGNHVIAEIGGL